MIAARQIAFGKAAGAKGPTAKDYVQDGLIAMWDGIENAGWGTHDPNATMWKDLVGAHDLPVSISNSLYFKNDSLYASDGQYAGYTSEYPVSIAGDVTFEACWSRDSKFYNAADSQNKFGLLAIDVYNGALVCKVGSHNIMDFHSVGSVSQGQRFTMSVIGVYGDPANNVIAYCNGKKLINGSNVSGSYGSIQLRVGSGWNLPKSHHCCIRLYSRALTAEEVAHNYSIDKARFGL